MKKFEWKLSSTDVLHEIHQIWKKRTMILLGKEQKLAYVARNSVFSTTYFMIKLKIFFKWFKFLIIFLNFKLQMFSFILSLFVELSRPSSGVSPQRPACLGDLTFLYLDHSRLDTGSGLAKWLCDHSVQDRVARRSSKILTLSG